MGESICCICGCIFVQNAKKYCYCDNCKNVYMKIVNASNSKRHTKKGKKKK